MNNNEQELFLKSITYKPIILDDGIDERLSIIYSYETNSAKLLNIDGSETEVLTSTIYLIDINATLALRHTVLDKYIIVDWQKVKDAISLVDPNIYYQALSAANTIIYSEMNGLAKTLETLAIAANTIRHITKTNEDQILDHTEDQLIALAHEIVNGPIDQLEKKDLTKIGKLIIEILTENNEINLDDPESLRRLKAEIDYKVTDIMPDKMRNININMPSVINEIKKIKEFINEQEPPEEEV
jgi:hypothetical protein